MTHSSFATIILVTTAYYLGVPDTAMAAEGKCTSAQAQCALEIGGSPHAGGAFSDCVSRKLAGRK